MKYYIGIDIGGTFIKCGVVTSEGVIVEKRKIETPSQGDEVLRIIIDYTKNKQQEYDIGGVGISLPGVVKEDGQMQTAGAIKDFVGQNVRTLLKQALDIPVMTIGDSKAAGIAEKWIGKAKDIDNFVCMTLGTAIGGVIFINGKLYKGLGGLAGEFGVSLANKTDSTYSEQSFSASAGVVGGLCRRYSLSVKERVLDARIIIDRANQGDEIAEKFVEDFYQEVARLLVNISVTIAPETILIGGGISENRLVMDRIKQHFNQICKEYKVLSLVEMPVIETCLLKNDAGILGAVFALIKKGEII